MAITDAHNYIYTSRLFSYVGVERLRRRHLRPYRVMCDGIELSRHFTDNGAREALRMFDLGTLAWDGEVAEATGGRSAFGTPLAECSLPLA